MKSARLTIVVMLFAVGCGRNSGSPGAAPATTPTKPLENTNRLPGPGVGKSCYIETRFCVEAPADDRGAIRDLKDLCENKDAAVQNGTCSTAGHVASCVFRDDKRKIRYYNTTREEARVFCEEQGGGTLQDNY